MAIKQPVAFLALLGRVLPLQLQGDGKNPITIRRVEYVIIDPEQEEQKLVIEDRRGNGDVH